MENPIDNLFIYAAEFLNDKVFYPLHFTPNILTTISLIFGIAGAYAVYRQWFLVFAICYGIAYLFDCADGNFARRYNMVTKFGDWYDHIADITKFILTLLAIMMLPASVMTLPYKIAFLVILFILGIFMMIHIGCQEQNYPVDEWSTLTHTKKYCPKKEYIYYSRYGGIGTVTAYYMIFGIIMFYITTAKST
jgi:phosphatidylglycerophosphate synthase